MTAQLSAPAIGYRSFKWDGSGPLKAIGVEASWPISRAPQYAKCIQTTTPHHVAPQEGCTCGIHAYSTPGQVGAGVGGVVMGYGNLIIHPDGWRAEIVELIALVARGALTSAQRECEHLWEVTSATAICKRCRATMQATDTGKPGIDLLAEQYGVRALDRWEDAAAIAREYGAEPIPEILHAEAEAWHLGPEKHEPLFPGGFGGHYGNIEARVRELLPWVEPDMIRRVETNLGSPLRYMSPISNNPVALMPLTTEVRISVMRRDGAEVEITLHV